MPGLNKPATLDWLMYPAAASTLTLIVHFAGGITWGISAFASFVGWPVVGTFITADDDLPGGFSNPDGTEIPPWRTALWWGQLSIGFAVSAFVAALDIGLRTGVGVKLAIGGLIAGLISRLLRRQRR